MASRWLFRFTSFSILLRFTLIGCKQAEPQPPSDLTTEQQTVVAALDKSNYPIKDADPTREFSDLAVLDTLLAKAQVVGIGESTHGTHEFAQTKDRLFRYLVQTHHHQAIGIEASFGRTILVNRFIHGESSSFTDAAVAAKSLNSWPLSTTEVAQWLQWMREYNTGKSSTQQISVYGLDCPEATDEFPLIREFIAKVDPGSLAKIDSIATLFNLTIGANSPLPAQQYSQKLPELYNLFVSNETNWTSASGSPAYEVAKQAARVLIQQQNLASISDLCQKSAKRDGYLAENAQWLLTKLKVSKLSLWAHSTHIGDLPTVNCGQPTMGSYLKQQLKDQYVTIGTSLANGRFTGRNSALAATPLSVLSVSGAATPRSYNYLLGRSQSANFILNLHRFDAGSSLGSWLSTPYSFFLAGAGYDERKPDQAYYSIGLSTGFDVLIHFRDTSPTQLLP
ncbi:erythromycin esterase family protein [Spirosoma pollinicola]|uniref:Erythromycin esterase n=1 Tax=Spirosoma pollinicola TaxID=2057025 RepID=A0A2K8Z107_9BACT|nr:erythromycin esterase family protein [Spirosoma pollinicola]AUD03494.1 hypothetical protein CWM47_17655 [Spirosoma pollinicola]